MMGLDVSHDAFSGAYSAFRRFRHIILTAMGGREENGYLHFGRDLEHDNGLYLFLASNDCDETFTPSQAKRMADELENLLPKIKELEIPDGGHIGRDGGYVAVTEKFIRGCRAAHKARQKLKYR